MQDICRNVNLSSVGSPLVGANIYPCLKDQGTDEYPSQRHQYVRLGIRLTTTWLNMNSHGLQTRGSNSKLLENPEAGSIYYIRASAIVTHGLPKLRERTNSPPFITIP